MTRDELEVHITIRNGDDWLQWFAEMSQMKYSEISGWDETGGERRQFLTWHSTDLYEPDILTYVWMLRTLGYDVLRAKVESCVWEWRP